MRADSLFCFSGWFLWMVRVKTKTQEQTAAECGDAGGRPGGPRGTKIRTRCKGRKLETEVQAQIDEALLHIVQASVEKAKAGSLHHAKWLWAVAQEQKRKAGEEQVMEKDTLAMLLARELSS